jgi:ornithine carbamoyltransferase
MSHLGGSALHLGLGEMHLGRTETIKDTAMVLSRYLDAILIRTYEQSDVDELARHADVPVINGLTDEFHPCQALADAMTIRERFGELAGVRVAYVGDGNNVCHSLMAVCAKLGADMIVATPAGYEPAAGVVAEAQRAAAGSGGSVELATDPASAVTGADVVYTDVWTSMGQEAEQAARASAFSGFTVDAALVARASERGVVMHCLPAHWGEEITEGVLHGPRSAAWEQAENRLHAQKALLALIVR